MTTLTNETYTGADGKAPGEKALADANSAAAMNNLAIVLSLGSGCKSLEHKKGEERRRANKIKGGFFVAKAQH